jgi:WD40 repeat protein
LNVLDDASRFALRNRYIIDEAPLQIYMSALLFAPLVSNIRQAHGDSLLKYFDVMRLWDAATGEERQKLEGHDHFVNAVAFSPDGKTVASGSSDRTVKLWDAATGEKRQERRTSRGVSRIAFCHNESSLDTDIGHLSFDTIPATRQTPVIKPQPTILLETYWIKYCGADFLWLPHEYRGICHDAHGSLLVIGQASGAISFFSFK